MLDRYQYFRENLILEGIINETYVYYAPPLRKSLNRIKDNEIASELLGIYKTDIKPDVTFVNIDRDGYLSFTTARNAGNNLNKIWAGVSPEGWFDGALDEEDLDSIWSKHINKDENDVYAKSRNSLRIGRFINKILPGKYNDKQIEEFVNRFKASIEVQGEVFEIVEGDEIAKWYGYENYAENKGTLGNSCMKDKPDSFFEIYTKNPEVCRMLILKEDDKILGRAIIWKLNTLKSTSMKDVSVEYFLDRQYYIKESDVQKFRTYAKEQGWAYKVYNNHHSFSTIIFNDQEFNADITVKIKAERYTRYPYVDTFRRYDPDSGILYNDEEEDSEYEGQYILAATNGTYTEIQGGVWSEWHDRYIPEEYAVWSYWADSYLDSERAINITLGSRKNHGWYPEDCDDVVFDGWEEEYIHSDDSVYSDSYGYYLLVDNAVEVIADIDGDGDILEADSNWYHKKDNDVIETSDLDRVCYDRLTNLYRGWTSYDYIHKDLLIKNFKEEWIIERFKLSVYSIVAKDGSIDITGVEWLSEDDAMILGYDITTESEIVTDQFRYHKDIEELLPTIYRLCNKEISKIRDILDEKSQLRLKFDDDIDKKYINSLKYKLLRYDNRISDIDNKIYIDIDI